MGLSIHLFNNLCLQSLSLNKLGKVLLGDATYQSSMPCGSRQYFFMFSLYKYM